MKPVKSSIAKPPITLIINGMTCGHCVQAVNAALAVVPGVVVQSVDVGVAQISAPDGLTVARAVGGLGEAGYPARASGAGASACCGGGAAPGLEAARDGIGPGGHAAGVDAGLKTANLKHLKRIEGQVRGVAAMIDEDRYCADIIQQCAAVQESLRSVAKNLFRNHLAHCASRAMHGDEGQQAAMVEELVALVGKIAR